MGVWDMMYLMQQHKKALALASNPTKSLVRCGHLVLLLRIFRF
jgi:hypothetical protein